jgi:hypothetical protein
MTQADFYGVWVFKKDILIITADAMEINLNDGKQHHKISPITWTALTSNNRNYPLVFDIKGPVSEVIAGDRYKVGDEDGRYCLLHKDKNILDTSGYGKHTRLVESENQPAAAKPDASLPVTQADLYGEWAMVPPRDSCIITADTLELNRNKGKNHWKISPVTWEEAKGTNRNYPIGYKITGKVSEIIAGEWYEIGDDQERTCFLHKDKTCFDMDGWGKYIRLADSQSQQAAKAEKASQAVERKLNLQYIDCPTDHIDFEDISGIEEYKNFLFVNQRLRLTVWDMADPTDIKLIHEIPYPRASWAMQIIDDQLLIWGSPDKEDKDTLILVLDISDPLHVNQVGGYKFGTGVRDIVKVKGRLLAISGAGIYDFQADKMLCKAEDIEGYESDSYGRCWLANDDFIIQAGPHRGVYIYRIQPNGALSLAKHIETQYYMPFGLTWDVPGKSFIICGYDHTVLKFDMSVPEKTKRVKGAKTGEHSSLCEQILRDGNTLLVFGISFSTYSHDNDSVMLYEVDVSGAIPEILSKNKVKGFMQKGDTGSDNPRGIVQSGDYLILCSDYRQLGVVKIVE